MRKTLLITDDAEQENEDLDDFLPAADHDAEDFEDDNDEPNTESMDPLNPQSILSTPPSCHITPPSSRNTPKPILKVLIFKLQHSSEILRSLKTEISFTYNHAFVDFFRFMIAQMQAKSQHRVKRCAFIWSPKSMP